jgi:hypothetical protein
MAEIKDTLRQWIAIDTEIRTIQTQLKTLREKKKIQSEILVEHMKANNLDEFILESGNINRTTRTTRPALKRKDIRTQLLFQFADQPHRIAEALRAMEGIPEGGDMMSVNGTVRDVLSRRVAKTSIVATL